MATKSFMEAVAPTRSAGELEDEGMCREWDDDRDPVERIISRLEQGGTFLGVFEARDDRLSDDVRLLACTVRTFENDSARYTYVFIVQVPGSVPPVEGEELNLAFLRVVCGPLVVGELVELDEEDGSHGKALDVDVVEIGLDGIQDLVKLTVGVVPCIRINAAIREWNAEAINEEMVTAVCLVGLVMRAVLGKELDVDPSLERIIERWAGLNRDRTCDA